ncbi:hypothetical protein ACFOHS_10535 [Jhaorihella thermophila]
MAMIWVAAVAARTARIMREESQRLQTAIEAIRQTQIAQAQRGAIPAEPSVTRKLDEIAQAAKNRDGAGHLSFGAPRCPRPEPHAPTEPDPQGQAALALGTPADSLDPPLTHEDFIRALNFPETAEDEEGFAALRRALRDRKAALLIRAAQDVFDPAEPGRDLHG